MEVVTNRAEAGDVTAESHYNTGTKSVARVATVLRKKQCKLVSGVKMQSNLLTKFLITSSITLHVASSDCVALLNSPVYNARLHRRILKIINANQASSSSSVFVSLGFVYLRQNGRSAKDSSVLPDIAIITLYSLH